MSIQELVQSRLIGMEPHKPTEDEEQLGSTDECVTETEPTHPIPLRKQKLQKH